MQTTFILPQVGRVATLYRKVFAANERAASGYRRITPDLTLRKCGHSLPVLDLTNALHACPPLQGLLLLQAAFEEYFPPGLEPTASQCRLWQRYYRNPSGQGSILDALLRIGRGTQLELVHAYVVLARHVYGDLVPVLVAHGWKSAGVCCKMWFCSCCQQYQQQQPQYQPQHDAMVCEVV